MQKISALSNKIKILILILYTALVLMLAILIINKSTTTKILNGYSDKTYDEYVNLTVRMYEERKTSTENKGDYDSTTYNIRAFVEKKEAAKNWEIKDIKYYVTGINRKGKMIFDEPSTSRTYKISKTSTYSSTGSTSIIENKIFKQSITVDSTTEEETIVDNEPIKLYIKVTYVINLEDEDVKKEIKSEIKFSNIQKENFDNYESTSIVNNKLENNSEAIDVEMEVNRATEKSTSESAKKDNFDFETYLNTAYLGDKKIERFSVEVFGKLNNVKSKDNKLLSEYVRLYTSYGSTLTRVGTTLSYVKIDESYEVKELFIKTIVIFTDGTSSQKTLKVEIK